MQSLLMSPFVNKLISAFSWTLIHSLWQGLLFAILTGIIMVATKKSSAAKRYNLVSLLFAAFLFAGIATFVWEWNSTELQTMVPTIGGNISKNVSAALVSNLHSVKQLGKIVTNYFSANAPAVVLIWFVFFLFKSVKMMACVVYNQRIKSYEVYEPDLFWRNTVATLSAKLQINKAVKLLQSGYVKMPVVVGHLKPIILIPASLLAGLPAEQIEAILLHELAHIRRNDYFVNFLQNIAEAIFFFNPGLLWISSLLREERENCCDDIALAQTQNKRGFIEALISFKEHELYGAKYATAFMGKKNYLLRRVSRIMQNQNKALGFGEKLFFMASIVLLSVIITTTAIAQVNEYTKAENKGYQNERRVTSRNAATPKAEIRNFIVAAKRLRRKLKTIITASVTDMADREVKTPLIDDQAEVVAAIAKQPASNQYEQMAMAKAAQLEGKQQAEVDKLQADRDRAQADKDRAQAAIDRAQALKDRDQAVKDQAQAQKDREQAEKDRAQGDKDRLQGDKDRRQADLVRERDAKAREANAQISN